MVSFIFYLKLAILFSVNSNHKFMTFPLVKTKIKGVNKKFDLSSPEERKKYFSLKAGKEIEKLRNYFQSGKTFIAYLLGKKNAGKGTYSHLFSEIIGPQYISHISVGDVVREVSKNIANPSYKKSLREFLNNNYRGYISIDDCLRALKERSTKTLLPTEFILALTKRVISQLPRKTLFIDGFPRELDQVSYSLYFRDLIGYRDDPDLFILIDVPEQVIDERIKYRVVCPVCHAPANLKLMRTQKIGYDQNTKQFYLICDNPQCNGARMVPKEGDNLGIEAIRDRLEKDGTLIEKAFSLQGIPKILLRNAIPVNQASECVDDYEITPEYVYKWDAENKKVEVSTKPWIVKDDEGIDSYSLLPAPIVVSLTKQLVSILKL